MSFLEFVSSEKNVLKYLHNTVDEATALKIINNGFIFENRLDYTTDLVSGNDIVQLDYFKLIRKKYGDFTIVIHIGRNLIDKYNKLLKNHSLYFYEVLSDLSPDLSSDGEQVFILNKQFIKGFYQQSTKKYYINPYFNPEQDLDKFYTNFKSLSK